MNTQSAAADLEEQLLRPNILLLGIAMDAFGCILCMYTVYNDSLIMLMEKSLRNDNNSDFALLATIP